MLFFRPKASGASVEDSPSNPEVFEGIIDRIGVSDFDFGFGYLTFVGDLRVYQFSCVGNPSGWVKSELILSRTGDHVRITLAQEHPRAHGTFKNLTIQGEHLST